MYIQLYDTYTYTYIYIYIIQQIYVTIYSFIYNNYMLHDISYHINTINIHYTIHYTIVLSYLTYKYYSIF